MTRLLGLFGGPPRPIPRKGSGSTTTTTKPSIAAFEMATKPSIAAVENFTLEMEKAVSKTFTSARTKKASKIYFGKTNVQLIWEHLCEQTFSLMNFNKTNNVPLLLMGI